MLLVNTYKILGITNDVTTCECCGRSDLKATVVIGNEDNTVFGYFGCDCARNYVRGTGAQIERNARGVSFQRAEMQRDVDTQIARVMQIERGELNYYLREQLGARWNELGLNAKMTPEARRDIYIAWKRSMIDAITA